MGQFEIIFIAIGLAMDATAVSLSAAAAGYANNARARFRLAFHFGLFQFGMPIIGWLLGSTFAHYIKVYDHWVAFLLLGIVGGRMIQAGLHPEASTLKTDPTRGMTLVTLSLATSIDALAVGLSLAMLNISLWSAAILIGVITALMSLLAIGIGSRTSRHLGPRAEILGGLILIFIGLRILITHIWVG